MVKKIRIDYDEELRFITECEKGCYTSISGKQRFIEFLRILHEIPEPKSILDVGGNLGTARWFSTKFPKAKVTILNNSDREIGQYPDFIKSDAQSFRIENEYDLVFAGEVIEHLYNPDGLICSCLLALKPAGHLVITTPNLSCVYNRIFLFFGWSIGNYFPSLKYITGNPFFDKVGEYGIIPDHKSVFTWKGLEELLEIYGFEVIDSRGYSYSQTDGLIRSMGDRFYKMPNPKLRLAANRFIPKKLREGMLFLCQTPKTVDHDKISKGIRGQRLWEL